MEENKNLWNKKMDELAVVDVLKLNVAIPIMMIGGVIAAGTVVVVSDKVITKFRTARENRKNKLEVVK
jgi:hypothetical protein